MRLGIWSFYTHSLHSLTLPDPLFTLHCHSKILSSLAPSRLEAKAWCHHVYAGLGSGLVETALMAASGDRQTPKKDGLRPNQDRSGFIKLERTRTGNTHPPEINESPDIDSSQSGN